MSRHLRTAALAALAAILALPAAAAQAPERTAEAEPPAFGEIIDVRVVNVEVVVTDKRGNRVTGLGPEDLILYVDGEDTPIDYFTEVRGGVALAPPVDGAALPAMPQTAPGEPVGTSYLVFVDDWFPIERDRNRVLESLADDLPSLGPNDRMAVVAFDGGKLEMLTSWTGSRRELERVLQQAMARPANGLQRIGRERAHEAGFASRPLGARDGFGLAMYEYGYARDIETRIDRAVGAAVATLRGFARPPGRKVMMVLSGGWPYSPALYVVNSRARPLSVFGYGRGPRLYEPLIDTANLLGYTLYPVDVPGLAGGFGADVERGGDPLVGAPLPLGTGFEREHQVHDTLYVLAQETGGVPLINSFRNKALPEVAADVSSYYWIGFTPDRRRDDSFHGIRVEALGRGLEVRTREGFRDLSRETEGDLAVESALLFGEAPTSGGLIAEAGTAERDGRRFMELPVTLGIPLDTVTTLPENGDHVAHLELRVAALDEKEHLSEVPTVPVELRFPEPPPAGTAVAYETRVRLRNRPHDLVVSIHDPLTGAHLMTRLEVAAAR